MFSTPLHIRSAHRSDERALWRLAALDSAPVPSGEVLVAEEDGELVAALPVMGGAAIADPFRLTAEAVAMLELRATQLRDAPTDDAPYLRWFALHDPGRVRRPA